LPDISKDDATTLLQELNFRRVIVIPDLAGAASLWVTARDLGGSLGFEIKKNLMIPRNHVLKFTHGPAHRSAAVCGELAGDAPGCYLDQTRQPWPGLLPPNPRGIRWRALAVWKLRTMHVDGDRLLEDGWRRTLKSRAHWNSHFKLQRDPRVLPVIGRILRHTSLDELPQVVERSQRGD